MKKEQLKTDVFKKKKPSTRRLFLGVMIVVGFMFILASYNNYTDKVWQGVQVNFLIQTMIFVIGFGMCFPSALIWAGDMFFGEV